LWLFLCGSVDAVDRKLVTIHCLVLVGILISKCLFRTSEANISNFTQYCSQPLFTQSVIFQNPSEPNWSLIQTPNPWLSASIIIGTRAPPENLRTETRRVEREAPRDHRVVNVRPRDHSLGMNLDNLNIHTVRYLLRYARHTPSASLDAIPTKGRYQPITIFNLKSISGLKVRYLQAYIPLKSPSGNSGSCLSNSLASFSHNFSSGATIVSVLALG
jgi:hypothetical protein